MGHKKFNLSVGDVGCSGNFVIHKVYRAFPMKVDPEERFRQRTLL